MTSTPPGWYPDSTVPNQMRWWDGGQWTSDVFERVEPPGGFLAAPADRAAQQQAVAPGGATTDDGAPLASWGRRLAARLVDALITTPLTVLLSLPLVRDLVRHITDISTQQASAARVDPLAIYDARTLRSLLVIGLVSLLVSLVYEMAFLLWRAATPGKLLLGLRVRRWAAGERLEASVVARRWIGYQALGQILGFVYTIIDGLWPLWDPRRQALHDKLAGTCVVQVRR